MLDILLIVVMQSRGRGISKEVCKKTSGSRLHLKIKKMGAVDSP